MARRRQSTSLRRACLLTYLNRQNYHRCHAHLLIAHSTRVTAAVALWNRLLMNFVAKWEEPMGCPRKRVPVVSSADDGLLGERSVNASWRQVWCAVGSWPSGDALVVDVRIYVFDTLSCIPMGSPSCWNRWINHAMSWYGRQMDVSSMMDAVWATPPLLSS